MLRTIKTHLSLKLFLSYFFVVFIGIGTLALTVELFVPNAFQRHLGMMNRMMQGGGGGMMAGSMTGDPSLFMNFREAVNEALIISALAGLFVALIVSLIISRSVVGPIREMMVVSQRISEGHYHDRVLFPGEGNPGDIDELGQLARSFNSMTVQLEQVEGMRVQMIGDVAHEMRTPLTVIKGSMEGLLDGVLPDNSDTYNFIYQEADRLEKLVSDLQELSRVEAGAYQLDKKFIPARDLIDFIVSGLKRQFTEKGIVLKTEIDVDVPSLFIDEARIGQVLLNLLNNALCYTPAGGNVIIHVKYHSGLTRFEIEDTGEGIQTDYLARIFDRFYRVDKSRSRQGGGSGIGLTISRELVEAHGGNIWAESDGPGNGSTFIFTLPNSA